MTSLLFVLLKAALALMLAFLGGAFLRNVRGLCPENSAFALRRDRLLGLALYFVSGVTGVVAALRLATLATDDHSHSAPVLLVAAVLWGGALWLGLRRTVTIPAVRMVGVAAGLVLASLVVFANGALTAGDFFLLFAALVWLGATLVSPRGAAK